jgi:hypothetical protein
MRKPALRIAVHNSDYSDPSHLLWYLVIVMISCVGWLFYTIFAALR